MELKRGRAATKLSTKNPKNTKTHEEFSTTEAELATDGRGCTRMDLRMVCMVSEFDRRGVRCGLCF